MQILPTKKIRVIDSGHECVINVSDFDPSLHEEVVVAVPEKVATPEKAQAEEVGKKPAAKAKAK